MMIRRMLPLCFLAVLVPGQQCIEYDFDDTAPGLDETLPRITLSTSMGDIVIELFTTVSETAATSFRSSVESGDYDDTVFHEVVRNTRISGGVYRLDLTEDDPRDLVAADDNGLLNTRGRVALYTPAEATTGVPGFVISLASNGELEDYTVIGQVVEGLEDVADEIGKASTTRRTEPDLPNLPTSAIFVNNPDPESTEYPEEGGQEEPEFTTTDSGLQYADVVVGTGVVVTESSTVTAFYTGRLNDENGEIFDTTDEDGEPREFSLTAVIKGWQEGLGNYNMRVGGTRILIIPPDLGYGDTDRPGIPANSTLWFEVEIVDAESTDDDGDGVTNDADLCADTPTGETVDNDGCAQSQLDDDGDGVMNDADLCPDTSLIELVDATGCPCDSELDDDEDGVNNCDDQCPDTPAGAPVDADGCTAPEPEENAKVRLTTSLGDIVVEVYEDQTPITAANFLQYVDDDFYDGTIFHRVVPDFVVQGGGLLPGGVQKEGVRDPIVNEFSPDRSNLRGTVAMAKLGGDPDSATCQFFFNLDDNSGNLDNQNGGFTVFAEVVEGMDVVDAMAAVELSGETPVEDILLISATRE